MNIQGERGSAGWKAIVIIVIVVVGIVLANRWLERMTGEIVSKPEKIPAAAEEGIRQPEEPKIERTGDVIRKTRYSPDRKFKINVFYQEGDVIARNKTANTGEVYDQTGEIPDGKVKFFNESNESYGVEYYRNGQLDGPAKIFYSDDVLKQELYYQYGKKITSKEYYHDGSLRMEEDYSNAREYMEGGETGIGKLYFRDGKLKYEWHITVTEPEGYKKSYNRQGKLVGATYYDEYGRLIEREKSLSNADTALSSGGTAAIATSEAPPVPVEDNKLPKQIFVPMDGQ